MIRNILVIICFIISNVCLNANVTFEVINPGTVLQGDKFQLTFSLQNGSGADFKGPQIEGCKLLSDRGVRSSSSYVNINGKATSTTRIDYTCVYRADKVGKVSVPSVSINVDGKQYKSKPISFEIKENNGKPNQRLQQSYTYGNEYTTQIPDEITGDELFVKIILSKKTVYEQEPIECIIKLYTQYGIESFLPTVQPSFDGFIIEEVPIKSLNNKEMYNGKEYYTAVLKKCIIFPQKSGKLEINSGKYEVVAQKFEKVSFGGGYAYSRIPIREKLMISSNSASINIMPLPQPQPIDFSGAVGQFDVNTKLSANNFRTNEAVVYSYIVSGNGNLKYIKEPNIDFPSEFELYTPKTQFDVRVTNGSMEGTVIFDYTFVPQSIGTFRIMGHKFIYFDPENKEYKTIETKPYTLNIGKGLSNQIIQSDIKMKNNDILHLNTDKYELKKSINFVIYKFWYWALYILIILISSFIIYYYKKHLKLISNISNFKLVRANKVANKRLKVASKYMALQKNNEFYNEILNALWGYLSDKLSIPTSLLMRDNISIELFKYGASEALCNNVIEILDSCEMSLYSPQSSKDQFSAIYSKTIEVIKEIESLKIKK